MAYSANSIILHKKFHNPLSSFKMAKTSVCVQVRKGPRRHTPVKTVAAVTRTAPVCTSTGSTSVVRQRSLPATSAPTRPVAWTHSAPISSNT